MKKKYIKPKVTTTHILLENCINAASGNVTNENGNVDTEFEEDDQDIVIDWGF